MSQRLTALPVGAKVKDSQTSYNGKPIVWQVGGHGHYASGQTVLVSEKIVTLKAFDAIEASNTDSNRKSYGNNRYVHSNLRQWLNSAVASWYAAQHSADAPPNNANVSSNYNEYDQEAGFLTNFSANLRNALIPTSLTVAKNTVTDGGGSETVTDKVFLLSNTEVGLANENNVAEGKLLPLFTSVDSSRLAYPTAEAVSKSEYKDASNLTASKAWYWWLRSPNAGYSYYVRHVYSSGALNIGNAFTGYCGVRPALNLSSEILVSDSVDSDGAYTILWNNPPTISGTNTVLGTVTTAPAYEYNVNDSDSADVLIITEKIDGVTTKTINNVVRGQTYAFDFSSFLNLAIGSHTATITVSDGQATATRTITFTRVDDRIVVRGKTALETSIAATKIVTSGIIELASGATLKVEACNNGFDASPLWEDVTVAFNNKTAHKFANTAKTASKWGVNYRVTVLKNTATEKSYAKAIGISYE